MYLEVESKQLSIVFDRISSHRICMKTPVLGKFLPIHPFMVNSDVIFSKKSFEIVFLLLDNDLLLLLYHDRDQVVVGSGVNWKNVEMRR